jgi:hypothetical protein
MENQQEVKPKQTRRRKLIIRTAADILKRKKGVVRTYENRSVIVKNDHSYKQVIECMEEYANQYLQQALNEIKPMIKNDLLRYDEIVEDVVRVIEKLIARG